MNILYLCRQSDLNYKEPELFARAFRRRGFNVVCLKGEFPADGNIQVVLDQSQQLPKMIVLAESAHDLLPQGLEKVNIPTVSFQSDTYAYTRRRIRWSMLFDYAVVFHPGFEAQFRSAGHPRVITWSHAADPELFSGQQEQRTFEVGWVGRTDGNLYKDRRFVLKSLSRHFRMNDFTRFHFPDELAAVYCRSKIIVNVARDDYPQDANMRVFEAMASGALLITRLPSELTSIGFEEGVHFVGYNRLDEVVGLTRQYLTDDEVHAHESHRQLAKRFYENTRMTIACKRCCGPSRAMPADWSRQRENGQWTRAHTLHRLLRRESAFSIARTRSGGISPSQILPTHSRAACLLAVPGWLSCEGRLLDEAKTL